MSDPELLRESQRWLRHAGEDLEAANVVLEHQELAPREACWLAQQAAKKALKALLIFHGIDFPKTHDLEHLASFLPEASPICAEAPSLASLTAWAVEARYPGDWPEATREDATESIALAKNTYHRASEAVSGQS